MRRALREAMSSSSSSSSAPSASASSRVTQRVHHIPQHLRHSEGKFVNRRGQHLFYFSLFPAARSPLRGVVLYLHGTGDHCRRYLFLYERLCDEGFGVIAYDLLNHGASDSDSHGVRGHVRRFRHLVDDTNAFISFAQTSIYPDLLTDQEASEGQPLPVQPPLVITGISFGTLLGMHTVLSGEHSFHVAFWSGPMLGVSWTPALRVQAAVMQPLALLLPKARVISGVDYDLLCRDPAFMEDFETDPLTTSDDLTARTGQQVLRAMAALKHDKRVRERRSAFCAVPMLFLAGSEDHIADQRATFGFFEAMDSRDKEFKVFDGVFHCVYEDPEREDVLEYLTAWLRRRCPEWRGES